VWLGVTLLRCVGWLSRDDLSTRYKHAGPPLPTPEAQCQGKHTFEYAVVAHSGDWLQGGVPTEAESYVTPLLSAPLPAHTTGSEQEGVRVAQQEAAGAGAQILAGKVDADLSDTTLILPVSSPSAAGHTAPPLLPSAVSLYSIAPPDLLFSACKRSEAGDSLILRVYNTAPYPVEGKLDLALSGTVRQANLAERETSEPLKPETGTHSQTRSYRFTANKHEIVTFLIRSDNPDDTRRPIP
jgi:alpha-mannosidase